MSAIIAGSTSGSHGFSSLIAEKISTRLIESMPRSSSRSMSIVKISFGYPVLSATTSKSISVKSISLELGETGVWSANDRVASTRAASTGVVSSGMVFIGVA